MNRPSTLAKISRPALFKAYPRERLFKKLDDARNKPIIWVKAPPGAGKTTLLSSYIESRDLPYIWYQIDEGDRDLASFFYHMSLACNKLNSPAVTTLPSFSPEYYADLGIFTRNYFRALYNCFESYGLIVIDNTQDIQSDYKLYEVLQSGLAEIPEHMNVALLSRSDPPGSLARLQISGAITTLDWDLLKLTHEETIGISQLLENTLDYSQDDIKQVYKQTQGWVAGLVLLLERTGGQLKPLSISEATNRDVLFNYFAGEIFQGEDLDSQEFLLKTSLLPKMTVDLAIAYTKNKNAQKILDELVQSNYFTLRHNELQTTYEYHPLFKEFLTHKATVNFPKSQILELQAKAATLLAESGELEAAATLFIQTKAWQSLVNVILNTASELLQQGRRQTLQSWLEILPDNVLSSNPWLMFWYGSCLYPYKLDDCREQLEMAYKGFKKNKDSTGIYLCWGQIVETYCYVMADFRPLDYWLEEIDIIREEYPEYPSAEIEARTIYSRLASLMWRKPGTAELKQAVQQAETMIQRNDISPTYRLLAGYSLMLNYIRLTGDFTQAGIILNIIRPIITQANKLNPMIILSGHMMEAAFAWVNNNPKACLQQVKDGLSLANETGVHIMTLLLNGLGVYANLLNNDSKACNRFLSQMDRLLNHKAPADIGHYHYLSAWTALTENDIRLAKEHAESSLRHTVESNAKINLLYDQITLAQTYLESDDADKAYEMLIDIQKEGKNINNTLIEFHCLLTIAYINFKHHNKMADAKALLQKALIIGKQQSYIAFPWLGWRNEILTELMTIALKYEIEVEYVQNIIQERNLTPNEPTTYIDNWPWPIKINSLHNFSVHRGNTACKILGKPADLLKILINSPKGRGVSENCLIDQLWPDAEGDSAHHTFETTLYRLRKMLGISKALIFQDNYLSIDTRYCWVDIWAIENQLNTLNQLIADSSDTKTILDTSTKLFSMYIPPSLDIPSDTTWPSHEQIYKNVLNTLEKLGNYWETHEEWIHSIDCYQRAITYNPSAEGFYQQLMQCYQMIGRRAEALAIYEQCKKKLNELLGVSPSSETENLHRNLLQEKPANS